MEQQLSQQLSKMDMKEYFEIRVNESDDIFFTDNPDMIKFIMKNKYHIGHLSFFDRKLFTIKTCTQIPEEKLATMKQKHETYYANSFFSESFEERMKFLSFQRVDINGVVFSMEQFIVLYNIVTNQ